jgi:chlorite dismutase
MKTPLLIATLCFLLGMQLFAAETKFPKTFEQYEVVRAGLASDDLAAAKNGATNLVLALQQELPESKGTAEAAQKLASSESIEDARAAFRTISSEVAKLAEGQPGFYIVTCPMVKNGIWVQTNRTIGNPYAGKAMASCGEIKSPAAK